MRGVAEALSVAELLSLLLYSGLCPGSQALSETLKNPTHLNTRDNDARVSRCHFEAANIFRIPSCHRAHRNRISVSSSRLFQVLRGSCSLLGPVAGPRQGLPAAVFGFLVSPSDRSGGAWTRGKAGRAWTQGDNYICGGGMHGVLLAELVEASKAPLRLL
ncbi:unnamed protein product [Effrenium voratum]|nr:unnamed protein product [Effrenium voratum]